MESNQLDESRREYYKAIIGPKNQDYYLSKFAKFDSNGKIGVSWNWPAFFLPFFWLYYRKMRGNAWLYLVATWMIGKIIGSLGSIEIGLIYIFISSWLLPAMFANAIYYSHCNEKINEKLSSSQDSENIRNELSLIGGVSQAVFALGLIFSLLMVVVIFAIALPAYQDYNVRTKVSEGVSAASSAKNLVSEKYAQTGHFPEDSAATGYIFSNNNPNISDIKVKNGSVKVTMASDPVEGGLIIFTPSVNSNNEVVWKCSGVNIKNNYLPAVCRE